METKEEMTQVDMSKFPNKSFWMVLGGGSINKIIEALKVTGEDELALSIRKYVEEDLATSDLQDQYRDAFVDEYGIETNTRDTQTAFAVDDNSPVEIAPHGAWIMTWMFLNDDEINNEIDVDIPSEALKLEDEK